MTENSGDSGFTEFNSPIKIQESDEAPLQMKSESPPSSSSSDIDNIPKLDSVATCQPAPQQSTNNDSTDDDDSDDDDYNDSDGSKPDILQWVQV